MINKLLTLILSVAIILLCVGCSKTDTVSNYDWKNEWLTSDIPSSTQSSKQENDSKLENQDKNDESFVENPSDNKDSNAENNSFVKIVEHEFKYLENTYYKLINKQPVAVAFLGGSVTDGYGATNQTEKAWPRLVVNKLSSHFSAYVMEVRKSIGGTGSSLAAFRYDNDLASAKPDLLFIEFAINDRYMGHTYDEVIRYSESIVRKAYSLNPYIDIIYVLTMDSACQEGGYEQANAHRYVAEKYDLLCVDIAKGVQKEIQSLGNRFSSYVPDGVHPNDRGYQLYADLVNDAIFDCFPKNGIAEATITKKELPSAISDYMKNPQIITADKIALTNSIGWLHKNDSNTRLGKWYGGKLVSTKTDNSLIFEFTGTDFGFCYQNTGNKSYQGTVQLLIDDNEPEIINVSTGSYFVKRLLKGKHHIKIKLLKDESGEFGINAFLIN